MNARWLLLFAVLGCRTDPGHTHEAEAETSLRPVAMTIWTERAELFMEHAPLIAGAEVSFVAHLTLLSSFAPLTEGAVTITIAAADGTSIEARAEGPSSPGIFRPAVTPAKAGKCSMRMAIASPVLTEQIELGSCEIFADRAAAQLASGDEEEETGRITFLKEQQWKTDFAAVPVGERELQPSVSASGEIRAAAGREGLLSAVTPGRVVLAEPPPILGMTVEKGQLLATIAPRSPAGIDRASLEAEVASARAEREAAETQLARAERLFSDQAIAERSLEEARTRARIAQARLEAASSRLASWRAGASGRSGPSSAGIQVRSPIAGTLVAVNVASGRTVEEGAALFTVIDLSRVWIEARIFEPDIPKVEGARGAWFTVEGREEPFRIDEGNGKLITVGHVIDPKSRTVPIVFEIENRENRLRIGQFAAVSIASGEPIRAPAIPESAIVEEAGRPLAYVMIGGESFERRALATGIRDRGMIQVLEGLAIGERVVTKGAYELKLAGASGALPEHGHSH